MLPWEEGGRAKEVIKTRSGRSQTAGVWAGDTRRTVVTAISALCQATLTAAGNGTLWMPCRGSGPARLPVPQVHLKSQFILNGVCVVWRGWIDLVRLDGIGCLEFDDERAEAEDALLREQIEEYNRRLREFEERQRQYRQEQERQAESEAERLVHALRSADMGVAPASSPGDEPFCPPLMAGSFGTPVTRPHLSVMKAPLSEVRTPALVKDVHTPTDLDLTKAPRPVYLY
ncbi:uncharacterized protein LOC112576460 isoform X3 [Pomacea canaliculata]|uniref:uncharacterized protein LOC112576460 isoform X3 n=1 Tax=Pomacea canaliculata TaxID=400727 RepID=UPI000D7390D1|nr:uncharacterized protein LOC112576460 isoform X3 [Pomacea canaliculata]